MYTMGLITCISTITEPFDDFENLQKCCITLHKHFIE